MLSQSDIFAELKRQREKETNEGWTAQEYAKNLGVQLGWAREKIKAGIVAGTIERIGYVIRHRSDGMTCRTPAYLFTNAQPAKTKARNR